MAGKDLSLKEETEQMETSRKGEKRVLDSIPVGSLGLIPLAGCRQLGEKVDRYLTKWRMERESEHKDSLAFAGYERPTYIVDCEVPAWTSTSWWMSATTARPTSCSAK